MNFAPGEGYDPQFDELIDRRSKGGKEDLGLIEEEEELKSSLAADLLDHNLQFDNRREGQDTIVRIVDNNVLKKENLITKKLDKEIRNKMAKLNQNASKIKKIQLQNDI